MKSRKAKIDFLKKLQRGQVDLTSLLPQSFVIDIGDTGIRFTINEQECGPEQFHEAVDNSGNWGEAWEVEIY